MNAKSFAVASLLWGETYVAHNGYPSCNHGERAIDRRAAALHLHGVASGVHEASRRIDRKLVRTFVRPERKIPNQERARSAAARGPGEHEHLVNAHDAGGLVAKYNHRRRVADENEVDAGLLGDLRGDEIVGGDHHDRR